MVQPCHINSHTCCRYSVFLSVHTGNTASLSRFGQPDVHRDTCIENHKYKFSVFRTDNFNAYPVPKHWLYSTEYNHNPVKRSFSACADCLGILAFWADIHMADISHIRKYCSFSNLLLYLCVVPGTTGLPASVPRIIMLYFITMKWRIFLEINRYRHR